MESMKTGRIEKMTRRNAEQGRKAFVAYFMAGDPDPDTTYLSVMAAIQGGASLIELGVPYSDPAADGPVIRRAGTRALAGGTSIADVFCLASRIRKAAPDTPMALMLYYNIVYRFGVGRFFETCRETGIDACILPDLPLEEQNEIRQPARDAGIRVIQLVAPNSGENMSRICAQAESFLYCVSLLGTTGERTGVPEGLYEFLDRLSEITDVPRFVGFGISTPDQAGRMASHADGVIVGSALVRCVEECVATGKTAVETAEEIQTRVSAFCAPLLNAASEEREKP